MRINNLWLSFDLPGVVFGLKGGCVENFFSSFSTHPSRAAHIAWPCSPYKFTCENTNQIHSWVLLS